MYISSLIYNIRDRMNEYRILVVNYVNPARSRITIIDQNKTNALSYHSMSRSSPEPRTPHQSWLDKDGDGDITTEELNKIPLFQKAPMKTQGLLRDFHRIHGRKSILFVISKHDFGYVGRWDRKPPSAHQNNNRS